MSSRRCYVETDPDGRPQFVTIKRSRSYHHHNHKRHCDYYTVNREEWKALVERTLALEEANEAFGAQNDALRTNLSLSQVESHRLSHVVIPQLQEQIANLSTENKSLRRSLDSAGDSSGRHHREVSRLRHKVGRLEKDNKHLQDENGDLRFRLHELSKQLDHGANRRILDLTKEIETWTEHGRYWKTKFEDLQGRYSSLCSIIDTKSEKIVVYEDILKRHRLIV